MVPSKVASFCRASLDIRLSIWLSILHRLPNDSWMIEKINLNIRSDGDSLIVLFLGATMAISVDRPTWIRLKTVHTEKKVGLSFNALQVEFFLESVSFDLKFTNIPSFSFAQCVDIAVDFWSEHSIRTSDQSSINLKPSRFSVQFHWCDMQIQA